MLKHIFDKRITNALYNTHYGNLNIRLFDTSLRDGIQCAIPHLYPLQRKIDIVYDITTQYCPTSIEIGSLVSPKILPIMEDTPILYTSVHSYLQNRLKQSSSESTTIPDIYVLIPNSNKLIQAIHQGITNFSFITSVSSSFQLKNTGKSIMHAKKDLENCFELLQKMIPNEDYKTKLYISCISQCPLEEQIDLSFIVKEIVEYHQRYPLDELCLSDTCGTLEFADFEYIISSIRCLNVPLQKISIHLHINPDRRENIQQILWYCFDNGVHQFDVSVLNEGGCSVTMKNTQIYPNMNYEFFYDCLDKYLENKMN